MTKKFLPLSRKGFAFAPFEVPNHGVLLSSLNLPSDLEVLAVQRGGVLRTLAAREMAYHHVAQGELNGEPYMVSF